MARPGNAWGTLVLLVAGIVVLAVGGEWWLRSAQSQTENALIDTYKTELQLGTLRQTQTRAEFFFKNVYETARTISLIPGIRAVRGGNRSDADEDVVAEGRLDKQTDIVIRNLYLNLAGNFTISEIYGLLNGFDPAKGQVPFFMYDSVVTGILQGQGEGADVPAANEDEEYQYFPSVLAEFQKTVPQYTFTSLATIPVLYSPTMLTCDNSQYLSIKDGSPEHTRGMISSVPLYGPAGELKGLIAVIYRVDTLTALVLGVPFLPITDADKARAKELNFDWPASPIPLLLEGPNGISISDPRAPQLSGIVEQARSSQSPDLLTVGLKLPGAEGWSLSYWISPEERSGVLQASRTNFALVQAVYALGLACVLILTVAIWNGSRRRRQLILGVARAITQVGEGDLGTRIDSGSAHGDLQTLGQAFSGMVGSIRTMVDALKVTLESSSEISQDLASSSEQSSAALNEIQHHLQQISEVVVGLEGLVGSTMDAIFQHSQAESMVRNNMEDLARRVVQTSSFVQMSMTSIKGVSETMAQQTQRITTLGSESRDARNRMGMASTQLDKVQQTVDAIGATVATIGDITAKTKLLAMNAAIEAAHAGASGRGFAVVSQNIRSLAEETEIQSRAIGEALKDLVTSLAGAKEAQSWTGRHLGQLLDNFETLGTELTDVAENLTELGEGSHEVLRDLEETQEGSHRVMKSLDEMGQESQNLVGKIQELVEMAQTTTNETQQLESAMLEVAQVVDTVANSGTKNLVNVETLVRQAERFRD